MDKRKKDSSLENLDLTDMDIRTDLDKIEPLDKIWIIQKMNLGPEIGLKARTKYGVYSCPSLLFLRIENRAKTKRHVFCSGNLDFWEKTLKEWDNLVQKNGLKPQSDWIKDNLVWKPSYYLKVTKKDNLVRKRELKLKWLKIR